jgi:hypothetical protein
MAKKEDFGVENLLALKGRGQGGSVQNSTTISILKIELHLTYLRML